MKILITILISRPIIVSIVIILIVINFTNKSNIMFSINIINFNLYFIRIYII